MFSGDWITSQLRYLSGRILTIIDSAITDTRQNKAIKDLIRGEFISRIAYVSDKVVGERHVSDKVVGERTVIAPEGFDPEKEVGIKEEDVLGI